MLLDIKGVGPECATILWWEGLFRRFDNRRQVAAYAGLAPTPWQSGSVDHEQGVSKSGNPRLRTTMIQLAWLWLRHQPRSGLREMIEASYEMMEVRQVVHDEYNRRVDEMLARMVWSHKGVRNWYKNDAGRVVILCPWRLVDYWKMTRALNPDDFVYS